jgi:hypothetical protein
MKRLAVWMLYAVGALAIGYLALYAYAAFTGRDLQPGDPIHIFRKPDAPSYSSTTTAPRSLRATGSRECAPDDKLREEIQNHKKDWMLRGYRLLATTASEAVMQLPLRRAPLRLDSDRIS